MAVQITKNKRLLLVVGLAVVAVIIKWLWFKPTFLYAGTLDATKVDLSSRLDSAINNVNVYEGDHVQQGQELIVLACEDYKVDAQIATLHYNRILRLFQKQVSTQDELDIARNREENANIRVSWCSIRSPINGTVLTRYHEPGEYASSGLKILTLANIRDIWAYIYVPQPEVAKLKVGQKVIGILPELNNREFVGHILKINSEAEFTPKNVQTRSERTRLVYGVKVSFNGSNDEEILKPGMTIEVKLPED